MLFFNALEIGDFTPEVIAGSNLTRNDTSKAYSNNTTVVVAPKIDLTKVADKKTVNVGDLVTFTITVTVIESGDITYGGIYVVDELPDGLEFVSFDGNGWSKDGNVYSYSGRLGSGESASFTIVCKATKVANVTNVATVFLEIAGSVNASADVSIVNGTNNGTNPVEPVTPEKGCVNVQIDSKATGNPLILLLLVVFAFIPLRRRKQ